MSDASKLKFTGSFQEVKESVDGIVFYGENGEAPILVDVKLGEDSKDSTIPVLDFVIAASSFKRPHSDSFEPIETREVTAQWKIKPGSNAEWTIRAINDGLGLKGADQIIDDGESWMRLVSGDHPKSLVKLIGEKTKSLLIKVQVKPKNDTEASVFYNLHSPPARESAKKGGISLADLKKRFGGGSDSAAADEPNF